MLPTKFRFIWPYSFREEDLLEIGQSETRIACGGHACLCIGPYIDTSYQVSVHVAMGFQRRRLKCEKITDERQRWTDDGCQVMAIAHVAFGKVS